SLLCRHFQCSVRSFPQRSGQGCGRYGAWSPPPSSAPTGPFFRQRGTTRPAATTTPPFCRSPPSPTTPAPPISPTPKTSSRTPSPPISPGQTTPAALTTSRYSSHPYSAPTSEGSPPSAPSPPPPPDQGKPS